MNDSMKKHRDLIRRMAPVTATAKDKGVELTFNIALYDNGLMRINGEICGSGMTTAIRMIVEALEELEAAHQDRIPEAV